MVLSRSLRLGLAVGRTGDGKLSRSSDSGGLFRHERVLVDDPHDRFPS
jgi:hypothetical protein